jgi:hypothetical protein
MFLQYIEVMRYRVTKHYGEILTVAVINSSNTSNVVTTHLWRGILAFTARCLLDIIVFIVLN